MGKKWTVDFWPKTVTPVGLPDSGFVFIYFKADNLLYAKDDTGTEHLLSPDLLASNNVFTGINEFQNQVRLNSEQLTTFTGDVNNFVLGVVANSLIITSNTQQNTLTGIAGGVNGRLLMLRNAGPQNMLLTNQDAGSSAANRFYSLGDYILYPGQMIFLWYSGTVGGWTITNSSSNFIARNVEFRNISSPSAPETDIDGFPVFTLTNGQTKSIETSVRIPDTIDINFNPVMIMQFAVTSTGGSDGNVDINLELGHVANGGLTSSVVTESPSPSSIAVTDTLGLIHTVVFVTDGSLFVPGGRVRAIFTRTGGSGTDTYSGDIGTFTNLTIIFRGQ